ncbi:HWE histidine kinase domain-containing protein [Rhizobium halophytocola]|uniref:histidine kinase n=1 Tax=Rhizobium halophytocola TaxID=735519 RepID=A0ABS4E0C7_9HYPH|nr:HWE histidine kinase domain-containing protein [Rhizobium halophytocola]MBP1851390.1 two-component sensor histidine kinase [Rhizobium halophytocola]
MHGFLNGLPAFRAIRAPLPVSAVAATYIASLCIFAAAFGLRVWLDPYLLSGFPYVSFFPAVVICGFVFGVPQGTLVAVLSGFASWFFFIPPYYTLDVTVASMAAMALYVFVVVTDLLLIYLVMRAYRAEYLSREENQRMAEHREVMARELDHRLKNVFATVNAIIGMSLRHATSPEDLARGLRERLSAMGRSTLLLRGVRPDEETTLEGIIVQALEPFGIAGTSRLVLSGPKLLVGGETVVVLGLMLHEMGTNAAKYGALSVPDGAVLLAWSVCDADGTEEAMLKIEWREQGGPPPAAAEAIVSGFGSTLLTKVIATIRGRAHMSFPASGAHVSLTLPLDALNPKPQAAAA